MIGWLNCYQNSTCETQSNNECGWTDSPGVQECLIDQNYSIGNATAVNSANNSIPNNTFPINNNNNSLPNIISNPSNNSTISNIASNFSCVIGGCGDSCVSSPAPIVNCFVYWNWYECLEQKYCNIQADGNCGFDHLDEINDCINKIKGANATSS